ncbi:GDSL esterase/lipase At2g23540-like [Hibiscus syriacus]|uniref:GDSL esterase/lipase At2g23540-like n=1 Tax=Hibiscus syriacus TaxID=106335 RepID=UPI00192334F7|nr:GDSL esterase/lipase At2g23540-like [Hibiscus syriacus]
MAGAKPWSLVLIVLFMMSLSSLVNGAGDNNNNDEGLGASFIFGYSLVDAGNNNYLQTLSKANVPPNGIDFKASAGQPTSRYATGRTIGDIVREELGVPNYAVPYLAPNSTGKAIVKGVNYASGGGIMNSTGSIFVNRLGLDIQIDYFNNTRKLLDDLLGASEAKDYISKRSILSITIGSNDFLNNYLLPLVSTGHRIFGNPDAYIDGMINHLRNQLTRLYQLNARKFIAANVGPVGCIPYQKMINQFKENQCVDLANKLAMQCNRQLKSLLSELNGKLQGAIFVHADVYDLVMELIAKYAQYGFTTAGRACCGIGNVGQFSGIIPCGPTSSLCDDQDKHVFWDAYHPSEAANLIIARQLVYGSTQYISPVNLKQLRNL